ncbi:MAG: ABC transporter ATP-binding protein [Candidatus Hydrothermales bacterium]
MEDIKLLRYIVRFVKPYSTLLFLAFIVLLVTTACDMFSPIILKETIDRGIIPFLNNGEIRKLYKYSIIYLLLVLLSSLSTYFFIVLVNYIGNSVMMDIRNRLLDKILSLKLSFFDRNSVGKIVTRLTNDVQSLNEFFSSVLVYLLKDILLLFGIFFVMLKMNTFLTLSILILVPSLFYVSNKFRRVARKAYGDIRKYISEVNTFVQESFSGIKTINIFKKEDFFKERFGRINKNLLEANIRQVKSLAIFRPLVDFHEFLSISLIILISGPMIVSGNFTIGSLVAFISYVRMFYRPIMDLSEKYNIFQSALAALERIDEIFREIPEVKSTGIVKKIEGNIVFKDVYFSYEEKGEWVLKGISLEIRKGEKVALVGPTGSGKSTIINLLLGFYPVQKGKILIDGIDIKDYDLKTLRNQIGVVLQENFIFEDTLLNNIKLYDSIPDEKIKEAIKRSYLSYLIERLPKGLMTKISSNSLSVGEKQLVAIARIFAFDKKIVILDEATSNIDSYTEYLIYKAIEELLKDRTSIIIAHRLSTIKNCDKIVVIFKGRIVEMGTHQELLEMDGFYSKLLKVGRLDVIV